MLRGAAALSTLPHWEQCLLTSPRVRGLGPGTGLWESDALFLMPPEELWPACLPPSALCPTLSSLTCKLWELNFSPPDTTVKKSLTAFRGASKGFIGHIYIYCKE